MRVIDSSLRAILLLSRLSHKVFLRPFRMTILGKGVMMRGMLIIIRSECEGSIPVVRKAVRCYQGNILHSMPLFRFLFFSHEILTPVQSRSEGGFLITFCFIRYLLRTGFIKGILPVRIGFG